MEAPKWYFEQECENDEYIHINDHEMKLGEIAGDVEQLIDEFYDDCLNIDRDVVHELLTDICKKLDMELPSKQNLKL